MKPEKQLLFTLITVFITGGLNSQPCPMTAVNNLTACAGVKTDTIRFAGSIPYTQFEWTNSNPLIGLPASGTGPLLPFIPVNNGSTPVTATVTVKAKSRLKQNAYICKYNGPLVAAVDTRTKTLLTQITVNSQYHTLPYSVATSDDGKKAYIACVSAKRVVEINTTTNTLAGFFPIPVELACYGVAVTPDGSKIYVACDGLPSKILVFDTQTRSLLKSIEVVREAFCIIVSPDGKRVYASHNGQIGALSVIDTQTDTLITTVTLGGNSHGLFVTSDNRKVYITNTLTYVPAYPGFCVSVVDAQTNTVIKSIPLDGKWPLAIAPHPDGIRAFTVNRPNSVSVLDLTADTLIKNIIFPFSSVQGISVTPDGEEMWLEFSSFDRNEVLVYNANTYDSITAIPVGNADPLSTNPITFSNFISSTPCSDEKTFTITVYPETDIHCNPSGNDSFEVRILPNLIRSDAVIRVKTGRPLHIQWNVYNAAGQLLRQLVTNAGTGQTDFPFPFERYPSGTYYLRGVLDNGKQLVIPFQKATAN